MTRAELIAALEAATGPSRELDEAIETFLFHHELDHHRKTRIAPILLNYTASLDAALTLVPPRLGIMWDVAKYPGESAAAFVGQRDVVFREFMVAKTPALALCIAMLRARGAGALW